MNFEIIQSSFFMRIFEMDFIYMNLQDSIIFFVSTQNNTSGTLPLFYGFIVNFLISKQ